MKTAKVALASGATIEAEVQLDSGGVLVKVSKDLSVPKELASLVDGTGYLWLPAHMIEAVWWVDEEHSGTVGFGR